MSFRRTMRYNWYHCTCDHELSTFITDFCQAGILAYSEGYAIILGIIGAVMCANDLRRIIDMGCNLPCHLHRVRKYIWITLNNHQYRDLKLAATAFTFEYYLLLIFGSLIGSEVFLVPWLVFDAAYLIFEFCSTIFGIIHNDPCISKPKHFLISMFMIYNWLAIFCASLNMTVKLKMIGILLPLLDILVLNLMNTPNGDIYENDAFLTCWLFANALNVIYDITKIYSTLMLGDNREDNIFERIIVLTFKTYHWFTICHAMFQNEKNDAE